MADTAVATNGDNPPAPVAGAAQQQPQSAWSQISGMVTRMFLFWMLISWLRGPNKQQQTATDGGVKARPAFNLLGEGNRFSLWVFVNEDATFHQYTPDVMQHLLWHQDELMYGAWTDGPEGDGSYSFTSTLDLSENVQNNGSLYMHTFLTRSGHVPFPNMEGEHDATFVVYRSKQLNRFKRRTIKKTQNLLTGETKTDRALLEHAEKHGPIEIVSHWHPNISVNLLVDHTNWVKGNVPAPLDQMINFDATGARYQPVLYLNDYWNLLREMTPINSTVKQVQLRITYQPISLFKLQMYVSQNMRNQWFSFMGDEYAQDSEEDQDALKEAILETNPYMLGLTVIVSIVHSIFEFLAFKNDIQFWKSRKSLEGLSVRSIVFSVLQSVIVLLYVMDNDTNFVIRVSIFIGCLIDAWKITKVMSVSLDRENRIFGLIPRPRFEDKSTYVESDTKKYDQLAFKYLGWLLFPLLVAYACYSLMYEEHKGVYSFVLGMLYGFLLTFGFIMMTPQLFINYKLKSVAHLPWRMLTYKALNTFIDDIFAFVIKMPTMYRIGCFRDDIVFFIYLYQRYKYRVDPTRLNEFGTSGVAPADDDAATDAVAAIVDTSAVQDKKND